jgi:hypothetical protein
LQACHDGVEQQHGGEDEDPAGAWDVAGGQGEHEDASENDDMDTYNRIHKIGKVYGGIINIGCN